MIIVEMVKIEGSVALLSLVLLLCWTQSSNCLITKSFTFNLEWTNVSRLCHEKQLLTVNGKYPGPTIAVQEGENIVIKVNNLAARNTTIHWHGVRQMRTGWADGPAYITQCPIREGQSYTYNFTVTGQRGTLLWHAHYAWQRASVYGAFIIYPRMPYPFPLQVHDEFNVIFGEWWNGDIDAVEKEMMISGGGPRTSDAYTINGLPGPLYPCSKKDTFIQTVDHNKTYLIRIINAAMNDELFFAVANHTLTVVEIDATYTKPFNTTAIMIAPGQTTNVLLMTNKTSDGMFVISARPYLTSVFPFDNSTTVGFLRYKSKRIGKINDPIFPKNILLGNLPEMKDTVFATKFGNNLRSLASSDYPCNVPKMDKRVIMTLSLNLKDCSANQTCTGYKGKRFYASMNNQSFVHPSLSILETHYRKIATKEFSYDFPKMPPHTFNYTGVDPLTENMNTEFGTKLLKVPYGTNLEIVLQDTSFLNNENHPIHIHGHNFFIVGKGFGNFDEEIDPKKYNLVDPPERNTVAVPSGGWAALRLLADNPGVWFVHCHLEVHTSWGLAMVLVVESGLEASQELFPPPLDLPTC